MPSRATGLLDKVSAFWLTLPGRWTISKSYALSSKDQCSKRCERALLALEDSSHSSGLWSVVSVYSEMCTNEVVSELVDGPHDREALFLYGGIILLG